MIDWKALWEVHCPHFKNGLATVPLPNGKSFKLLPGAGFGDGSHETTNAILSLLENRAKDQIIVDIGTGTAILALAAIQLGAKKVFAFEIDPDAIVHAKKNILLNNLEDKILLNQTLTQPHTLTMINMISSEQLIALKQYPFLTSPVPILTAGLLEEEETYYLTNFPNYSVKEKVVDRGWLAMYLA